MINSIRNSVEQVMSDDSAGTPLLRFLLGVLAIFYGFVTGLRNALYDRNILKSRFVPTRVISVGNITAGGTGKTPAAIMTAGMLRDAGYKVTVVSRGFKGSAKGPVAVSDGESELVDASVAGDEPLVIARALPGVPVVVGANRKAAADLAIQMFRPRVIVLDDAFQHRRLSRSLDIVTLDSVSPFGNEHLLPRGLLRESPAGLKRAGAVIVTRWDDSRDRGPVERMIRYYNRKAVIFFARHAPEGLRSPGGTEVEPPEMLDGRNISALSNIARPESFLNMLESLGAKIVQRHVSPDHHRYTVGELEGIIREAVASGAEMIVMTSKDERNIPSGLEIEKIPARVLDIRMELIDKTEDFCNLIFP